MNPTILITGITGMAGSHLADYLAATLPDCRIVGTKRRRSPLNNITQLLDRIELVDTNLIDAACCIRLIEEIRPDYIFHLAAYSYVADSWVFPAATISDNILMQLNILEAVRHAQIDPTIVVALSSEEYGKVTEQDLPITEKTPFHPLSPYAVSKVGQDMLAYQYFQSYGMKIIRTRAFNHEGPRRGEIFVTSTIAKQIAEIEAGLRSPVIKVGNLSTKRDWSDVRDIVRAYWLAVQYCTPGEDYNIASGLSRSVQELLDYMLSLTKRKIIVEIDPARIRPSDVPVLLGDAKKFRQTTGWQPAYSFEQTMQDLLNYWRQVVEQTSSNALTI